MKKYISFDYDWSLWSLSVSSCVEGNLLGIVNIHRDFWEKIQSQIHWIKTVALSRVPSSFGTIQSYIK